MAAAAAWPQCGETLAYLPVALRAGEQQARQFAWCSSRVAALSADVPKAHIGVVTVHCPCIGAAAATGAGVTATFVVVRRKRRRRLLPYCGGNWRGSPGIGGRCVPLHRRGAVQQEQRRETLRGAVLDPDTLEGGHPVEDPQPQPVAVEPTSFRFPYAPRPYQEAVSRVFSESAEKARRLRMQLACGTGKTFVYGMLICNDLKQHPGCRHVVFVPWRDLARQTAAELRSFGLRVAVVGDHEAKVDTSATVLVCVYASAHRLKGLEFRIKIVDEAHHVYAEASTSSQRIKEVPAALSADFSATFKTAKDLDYQYSLDQATKEGYVADVVYWMVHYDGTTEALVKIICSKCESWSPMFVVFNKLDRARECAGALNALGIAADVAHGGMSARRRCESKENLRCGRLKALCIVGVFNEGTSINELRSVVFADKRNSKVNLQQLAMRVTRLHQSKDHGNVVVPWPVDEGVGDERDLTSLVRAMAALSPQFEQRITRREAKWFRYINWDDKSRTPMSEEDFEKDESGTSVQEEDPGFDLYQAAMFDRLGRCLKPRDDGNWPFDDRLAQLRRWVEVRGVLPRTEKMVGREEHDLGRWLERIRRAVYKGTLSKKRLRQLQFDVPQLRPRLDKWALTGPIWDHMLQDLRTWIDHHDGALPNAHDTGHGCESAASVDEQEAVEQETDDEDGVEEPDEQALALWLAAQVQQLSTDRWLGTAETGVRRLLQVRRSQLLKAVPELEKRPDLQASGKPVPVRPDRKASPKSRAWQDHYSQLLRWVARHGVLPAPLAPVVADDFLGTRESRDANSSSRGEDQGVGEERLLATWLRRQLSRQRRGSLSLTQVAYLRQVPGVASLIKAIQKERVPKARKPRPAGDPD